MSNKACSRCGNGGVMWAWRPMFRRKKVCTECRLRMLAEGIVGEEEFKPVG